MNLMKQLDLDNIPQELVAYLKENPTTLFMLAKEVGVSYNTVRRLMGQIDKVRPTNLKVMLMIKKFLEEKKNEKMSAPNSLSRD
jgi:hypothetical protein